MKAPSPAFSLYPKDVLADENCSAMTHEEFGVYMRLLCHAWLEGSAPADPIKLQRLLGVRPQTLARIWPAVAPCFQEREGRLYQLRLEQERSKQRERSAINSEKGKRGGRPIKSTKGESHGFVPVKPGESLSSSFPSSASRTATTDKQTTVAIAPVSDFPSAKAVDVYRRYYPDGTPSGAMFKALRPLVLKHGWGIVEPEMDAYLSQTDTAYLSWPKFCSAFGTWVRGRTNGNGAPKGTDKAQKSMERALRLAGLGAVVDASKQRDMGPRDVGSGATPLARGERGDAGPSGGGLQAGVAALPDGSRVETRRE